MANLTGWLCLVGLLMITRPAVSGSCPANSIKMQFASGTFHMCKKACSKGKNYLLLDDDDCSEVFCGMLNDLMCFPTGYSHSALTSFFKHALKLRKYTPNQSAHMMHFKANSKVWAKQLSERCKCEAKLKKTDDNRKLTIPACLMQTLLREKLKSNVEHILRTKADAGADIIEAFLRMESYSSANPCKRKEPKSKLKTLGEKASSESASNSEVQILGGKRGRMTCRAEVNKKPNLIDMQCKVVKVMGDKSPRKRSDRDGGKGSSKQPEKKKVTRPRPKRPVGPASVARDEHSDRSISPPGFRSGKVSRGPPAARPPGPPGSYRGPPGTGRPGRPGPPGGSKGRGGGCGYQEFRYQKSHHNRCKTMCRANTLVVKFPSNRACEQVVCNNRKILGKGKCVSYSEEICVKMGKPFVPNILKELNFGGIKIPDTTETLCPIAAGHCACALKGNPRSSKTKASFKFCYISVLFRTPPKTLVDSLSIRGNIMALLGMKNDVDRFFKTLKPAKC